jgi:hypothetical protein
MWNTQCEFEDARHRWHAALWTVVLGILIGSYLAVAV